MPYQTLLVHLPADESDDVLEVATTLARDHGAHLTGLHLIPRIDVQFTYEVPVSVLRETETRARAAASLVGERFEAATQGDDFVAEWRVLEDVEHPAERTLIELGNTADLIVAGQTRDAGRRGSRGELTARVLAGAGRPMLLVPAERAATTFGQRVFVAWDGQRAATRALFGAMPMLERAESVRLQRINAPTRDRHHAMGATEELADTLGRHGVNVEVFHSDAREAEIGTEILRFAEDWGADALVAGGQEQGATREYLFGSTTRHLLEHLRLPLLTSC